MNRHPLIAVLALAAVALCAGTTNAADATPATAPSTMPTTSAASQPAATQPAVEAPVRHRTSAPTTTSAPATDPAAMKILKELDAAGDKYATIQANVEYTFENPVTAETEVRTGSVSYQKETDKQAARFRVHFETLKQAEGAKATNEPVDYAFDGEYLSVAKHRIKQLTRYQVVAPGQKAEPLRLGRGPFPMPFGQKADDVLKYTEVTTRPPKADDPKNTDYLLLTTIPARARELNFVTLEMWVDRDTHLPVKLISVNRAKETTSVVFSKIEPNKTLDAAVFAFPKPDGWTLKVVPLSEQGIGKDLP